MTPRREEFRRVLESARARIASRERFTTGTCARNRDGLSCSSSSPDAVAWCGFGALCAETGGDPKRYRPVYLGYLDPVSKAEYGVPFVLVGDRFGHAATLDVYGRALDRLLAEEDGPGGIPGHEEKEIHR